MYILCTIFFSASGSSNDDTVITCRKLNMLSFQHTGVFECINLSVLFKNETIKNIVEVWGKIQTCKFMLT